MTKQNIIINAHQKNYLQLKMINVLNAHKRFYIDFVKKLAKLKIKFNIKNQLQINCNMKKIQK